MRAAQTAAWGAMGAVCEAVCTKPGVLDGERFALKTMFNMGVSDAHSDAFTQCVVIVSRLAAGRRRASPSLRGRRHWLPTRACSFHG